MATIDKRLLPLIEALTATEADWIAFEMLEELRAGRVPEETSEDLHNVQLLVRSRKSEKRWSEEPASPPPPPEPRTGVEQIDWATDYVSKWVSDVLVMLDATLNQLDTILFAGLPNETRERMLALPANGITLVLQADQEEHSSVHRENAATARSILPNLRGTLAAWADSVRTQDDAG